MKSPLLKRVLRQSWKSQKELLLFKGSKKDQLMLRMASTQHAPCQSRKRMLFHHEVEGQLHKEDSASLTLQSTPQWNRN